MMRGRGCTLCVFVALLTLAVVWEHNQANAIFALPMHWMRPAKTNLTPVISTTTPEPTTQASERQSKLPKNALALLAFLKISLLNLTGKLESQKSKKLKLIQLMIMRRLLQLRMKDPLFAEIWNTFEQIEANKEELSRLVPI